MPKHSVPTYDGVGIVHPRAQIGRTTESKHPAVRTHEPVTGNRRHRRIPRNGHGLPETDGGRRQGGRQDQPCSEEDLAHFPSDLRLSPPTSSIAGRPSRRRKPTCPCSRLRLQRPVQHPGIWRPQPPRMRTSSPWSKGRLSASLPGMRRSAVRGAPRDGVTEGR